MTAILLVHGLSATNRIFLDLEKKLKRKKHIVYNPLLPGHGTKPEDLTKVSYQHLVDFLKAYVKPIIKQYKQIVVIAESFGANIVLDALAKKYIKGMVFLGTALKVRKEWFYQGIISLLKTIYPSYYYKKEKNHPRVIKGTTYSKIPLGTINMYFDRSKNFHQRIKTCFFPMLFLFAKHDFLIDTTWKKRFLKQHAENGYIQFIEYDTARHAILESEYGKEIISKILQFIGKSESKTL